MKDLLRPFEVHGVHFTGSSGNQAIGNCPFTDREEKFYVNRDNGLWDSKTAGLSGSLPRFLEEISKLYVENISSKHKKKLAADRGVPVAAFKGFDLGFTGKKFTLPIRNHKGRVQDIRLYSPGSRIISTAGCKTGLLAGHKLASLATDQPVYVCEGEWDCVAMAWLLSSQGKPGLAVAVPGASVFKEPWVEWFRGRDVVACYDHDDAGVAGELLLTKRLRYVARNIRYVHWPEAVETGFDLRDWISFGAVTKKTPKKCFSVLQSLIKAKPRGMEDNDDTEEQPERETEWKRPAKFKDVIERFKKWLYLKDTYAIEMMLAVALSNKIEGDPLWMFLVAPPGGAKTETLTSLALAADVHMTSSLTPRSLISGSTLRNGGDPSLIPKLNGRLLVIKDFTSILSMRDIDKDEIFGILRDAYDGRCGKEFGNGVTRSYQSRFTVIAAVTPVIYEVSQQHQSLGERFLKICTGDNLKHESEEQIIERSIENINQEVQMRWELQDVVQSYLSRPVSTASLPELPKPMVRRIIALAKFGARMRGIVKRDLYRNEVMTSRPSAEVGSRLGKQIAKLAQSLALVHRRKIVGEHEYAMCKKTILDTIPQRTEDVVRCLIKETETIDDSISTRTVSAKTRYPLATVQRVLADLNVLDIVDRTGPANKNEWTIGSYIRECIREARLYTTKEEQERKGPKVVVRVLKKAKRYRRAVIPQGG
jgi:hypothetical protein